MSTRAELYKSSLAFFLFLSIVSAINVTLPWWNNSYQCRAELNVTEANSIIWVQGQEMDMDYLLQFCGINGTFGEDSIRVVYQNSTDSVVIPYDSFGNSTNKAVFYYSNVSSQQAFNETKNKDLFHPNEGSGGCFSGSLADAYDKTIGDTTTKCGLSQGYEAFWKTANYSARKDLKNITVQLVWSGWIGGNYISLFMKNASGDYVLLFSSSWVPDKSPRTTLITICEEGCTIQGNPNSFTIDGHFEFKGISSNPNDDQGIWDLAVGYYYDSYNTTGENDAYYMYFSNESKETPEDSFSVPIRRVGQFSPSNCGGAECGFGMDGNWDTATYPDDWYTSATGSIADYVTKLIFTAKVFSYGEQANIDLYDNAGNRHYLMSHYWSCTMGEHTKIIEGTVCEGNCSINQNPNDFVISGAMLKRLIILPTMEVLADRLRSTRLSTITSILFTMMFLRLLTWRGYYYPQQNQRT